MDTPPPEILVERLFEVDGGWVAFSPRHPGCTRSGETAEEAEQNTAVAIADWLAKARSLGLPTMLHRPRATLHLRHG
jgi:predicted RNase H-like HicB family nuclease